MKRILAAILIIGISFSLSSCKTKDVINLESHTRNTYSIDVEYDTKSRTIKGNEILLYMNNDNTEDLYFHLYPNVYMEEKTACEFVSIPNSYPNGFNEGYIDITDVKINGAKVSYKEDNSLLQVDIPANIRQSKSMKVEIVFNSLLPDAKTRYGRFEGLTHCSYWYPLLAMYDENGWDKTTFYPIGESSYSDVTDYIVNITLPKNEVVCATGQKIAEKNKILNKKTVTYEENNIRDFAWFSSKDFKIAEEKKENTIYRYYYFDEKLDNPKEVMKESVSIFDFYNGKFGSYPYKQFNIVKTNVGTCEFPQTITVTNDNTKDKKYLRMALAHEIAHQWWYLTVGNNQNKEPWLDEALANYSMHLYNNSIFGDIATKLDITERYPTKTYKIPMKSSVEQFVSMSDYGDVIYNLGCIALYELNSRIGEQEFYNVMNSYYKEYSFKNAKINNFVETVAEVVDKETATWFNNLLITKEHRSTSKEQKELMQSQIIDTEREKLKSGEMFTYQSIKHGDIFLYKPIEARNYVELSQYENIMPFLKLQTVGKFNLNNIFIEPNLQLLQKLSKENYGIQNYKIRDINDFEACTYTYGTLDSKFILISVFSTSRDSNMNKSHDFITSSGKKLVDNLDAFFYSNENGNSVAYNLEYNGNVYGVTIMTNNMDRSIDIKSITKTIYEDLGK